MIEDILQKLSHIEKLLKEQNVLNKKIFDREDTCQYLKINKDRLYRLTCTNSIPCYKNKGSKMYFKKEELDQWLLQNKIHTKAEIDNKAKDFFSPRTKKLIS